MHLEHTPFNIGKPWILLLWIDTIEPPLVAVYFTEFEGVSLLLLNLLSKFILLILVIFFIVYLLLLFVK